MNNKNDLIRLKLVFIYSIMLINYSMSMIELCHKKIVD